MFSCAARRSYSACASQRAASPLGSFIDGNTLSHDAFDERILARLHLGEFFRRVDERVKSKIPVNQSVHASQTIQKSRGRFFDDDDVNVAVRVRIPARGGSEENHAFWIVWLERVDDFLDARAGASIHDAFHFLWQRQYPQPLTRELFQHVLPLRATPSGQDFGTVLAPNLQSATKCDSVQSVRAAT